MGYSPSEQECKGSRNLKQVPTAHPPTHRQPPRLERNECMPAYCSSSGLYSSTVGMMLPTFRLGFPTSMTATKIILISKPTGQWELGSPPLRPSFVVILGSGKLTFKTHHHRKHLPFSEILVSFLRNHSPQLPRGIPSVADLKTLALF